MTMKLTTSRGLLNRDVFLIGGRWSEPQGPGRLEVVSPLTGAVIGSVPQPTPADVDTAVAAARRAFDTGPWPRMAAAERAAHLLRLAEILRPRVDEAARLQVDEMGAPWSYLRPLTEWIIDNVRAEVATIDRIPLQEVRAGTGGQVLVRRQPVGVVAAVIPWNAPFAHALGKSVPALLAGCTVVVKPASATPLSAYLLADAVVEANLPPGVLSILAGGPEVGEHLVGHPSVDHVVFTGSTAAGRRIGALCGEQLKTATLELGGKSAAVVLADADLPALIDPLIASAMPNTGQVCHATTRILVPCELAEELTEQLVVRLQQLKVGNPHEPDTDFGPLVTEAQRTRVEGYIALGQSEGGRLALGGGRPVGLVEGWYVEPTVFTGVNNQMRIAREEIFGPVVCVLEYETEAEAVALANDSEYGLGGAVYTGDVEHGIAVAQQIRTGTVRINGAPAGGGGGPFSGIKQSGLGRKGGPEGYDAFFELSSITLPGHDPADDHERSPDPRIGEGT